MNVTTTDRIYNFSAGPAVLPLAVLEQAQRDLISLPGVGMSVLEISHRSKTFDNIIEGAEADLRTLLGIPPNYRVLFLQGGASLQFSMVGMNLMPPVNRADYILTGVWSKKALKEAKRVGEVNVAGSTESESFTRIPRPDEIKLQDGASYVHFTSNNTIYGTQWKYDPDPGSAPLVCDASSDFLCRPLDIPRYGLIYAGAQKNVGPAGVTLVVLREDLLSRCSPDLPTMLSYKTHADEKSLYNTPPVFAIYMVGLVLRYLIEQGGLDHQLYLNQQKAGVLYDAIDNSSFYRGTAEKESRSLMNVTFRLPSEELEAKFIAEAKAAGFDGLKGHRNVGGLRASIYNAFPAEGVDALVDFMRKFEKANG
ncbi:MAG: 3-phosphoserine/phosphohydroxythreonine transaminase [Armatimonadetes bacterium]|nr:3-phosphoserine/phosphohydroxythreonine transaminase [Armatimonadota bacterium]